MSAFANINVVDVALKEEGSGYGQGGTITPSTDGFEPWLESKIPSLCELGYLEEGDMGVQIGGLGEVAAVAPTGPFVKAQIPSFFRGSGAAYSASVFSSIHRVLKAAGYDAAGSFGAGTEKWDFTHTPEGTAKTSLFGKLMDRGEEVTFDGAYVNFKIDAQTTKAWKFTWELVGRRTSDVIARALGAVTYPLQAVQAPVGAPAAIILGTFTAAVVRSFSYDEGRSIENPRPNLNTASGHAGYQYQGRKPRATFLIEATSLVGSPYHTTSGINYYKLREAATQIAGSIQLGSAQYNRLKGVFPRLQLVGQPKRVESNGVACWSLEFAPRPSTPIASDDVTWTTD